MPKKVPSPDLGPLWVSEVGPGVTIVGQREPYLSQLQEWVQSCPAYPGLTNLLLSQ